VCDVCKLPSPTPYSWCCWHCNWDSCENCYNDSNTQDSSSNDSKVQQKNAEDDFVVNSKGCFWKRPDGSLYDPYQMATLGEHEAYGWTALVKQIHQHPKKNLANFVGRDGNGNSVLMEAVEQVSGSADSSLSFQELTNIIQILIASGANPKQQNMWSCTPENQICTFIDDIARQKIKEPPQVNSLLRLFGLEKKTPRRKAKIHKKETEREVCCEKNRWKER